MPNLSQSLYITYSNQKARDIKSSLICKPLDKVITLDAFILELYEQNNFSIIVDDTIGSSIIYKIIQDNDIKYFDYLDEQALSLGTIYSYIIKANRNDFLFTNLSGEKLKAIELINSKYQEFKQKHNLVDIADIENDVYINFENYFTNNYAEIFIDDFVIEDINYVKSLYQKKVLEKLSVYKKIPLEKYPSTQVKIIKPKNEVFDTIDEVKTAIKIARKLLEEGEDADDIIIVASDIQEYAPLYKLFLDEYAIKGFSSIGTPLGSYYNNNDSKVQIANSQVKQKLKELSFLYKKLGLKLNPDTETTIKLSINILDEKIGIELTEPNQLVGLSRRYKHVIFIGTDINHFPPKASDNFLYSYEDDVKYFYANNYFTSSQTQYNELKRLSKNLYIITASYSGKRELTPSILIGDAFDEKVDLSAIKGLSDLALQNQTKSPDTKTIEYYKSIACSEYSAYDGDGVHGIKATHLSASQINRYMACPLAYLYANKIKLQAPGQDEEGFDVMEQGSLMHLCYELFGRYIKQHHIKSTDQEELYNLMYEVSLEAYGHEETIKDRGEENIHHKLFLSTLQAGLKNEKELGLLAKFVNYYIKNADAFDYFQNTEFEKEFALDHKLKPYTLKDKEDQNYFIKGFIDRFDNLENSINIVDYKSKKVKGVDKEKQEEVDTLKDIQLSLYILYTKQQYPNKNYDSHLLSFKGNESGVKFASLANETFDGFEDELKQLIFDTKENIENGKFVFNDSDEKACGWCDIKRICHAGVLSKNERNN